MDRLNRKFLRCFFVSILSITVCILSNEVLYGQQVAEPDKHSLDLEKFKAWMKDYSQRIPWTEREFEIMLSRDVLLGSYKLGRQFIINNQKPAGNFTYEYDFIKKSETGLDNQVRQAGAVWALAFMYKYDKDPFTRKALEKALDYFFKHSIKGSNPDSLIISYPGSNISRTHTIAIITLAIIDYLHVDRVENIQIDDEYKQKLVKHLNGYLNHLKSARLENKHFSNGYNIKEQALVQDFDPYSDGEVLLAFTKAAKYLGYKELIPIIEESALIMAKRYTYDQWIHNYDSPNTKGFFQWSCMAFWEYQDAGWKDSEFYRDYIVSLAWWMINVHKTLFRQANTAYVYEGVIPALLVARDMERKDIISDLEYTIDTAFYKLTTWQVGGPLKMENFFLLNNPTADPKAVGGVMNYKDNPVLRIDVTQHQLHSIILALTYVYK